MQNLNFEKCCVGASQIYSYISFTPFFFRAEAVNFIIHESVVSHLRKSRAKFLIIEKFSDDIKMP